MEEKPARRERRLNPGFVLNAVCLAVILICFVIGGIQSAAGRRGSEANSAPAETPAADTADGNSNAEGSSSAEDDSTAEDSSTAEVSTAEDGGTFADRAAAPMRRVAERLAAEEAAKYDFTLAFMGDLGLTEQWVPMQYLAQQPNGIEDCLSPTLLEQMRSADLFCVNNEFAFTTRGQALQGKRWIITSDPKNVSILQTMGVDMVTLGNNHIYDHGPEGLTDTLATLDAAGIPHVGAGENLADASAPLYMEVGGKTIGFVNACNAEMTRYTPEATETSSGVLLCYEPDKFVAAVQEARANADYVIAIVHWGHDYVYETSDAQRTLGHQLIDAGADVVIGAHAHSLQGIEYYNGVPIFYGLGTCWFNSKTLSTYMLQLHFVGDAQGGSVTFSVLPGEQADCVTSLSETEEEAQKVLDLILKYSDGVAFERDESRSLYAYFLQQQTADQPADGGGNDGDTAEAQG